jgi:hypothetical protein
VTGIRGDVADGRAAIYADLLGYDEVAPHSGIERSDTLGVLRDIDRQVGRIERSFAWAPRPYHLVVLSDHGQTQGPTFEDTFGEGLEQLVAGLTKVEASVDPDSSAGNTESTAWFRSARGNERRPDAREGVLTVLGSGSIGLVYLPGEPRRLTLEEIDERFPELLTELRTHPGIGFLMVRSSEHGAMVLGASGHRLLDRSPDDPDAVVGDDPLAPFGPSAVAKVARADGFQYVADIMVNARYDVATDEIYAFERQVGSHGGLGGPQTHPFLLHPVEFTVPDHTIDGPVALHHVMKGWLTALGHPVSDRPQPEPAPPDQPQPDPPPSDQP